MSSRFENLPVQARVGVIAFAVLGALALIYSLIMEAEVFSGRFLFLLMGATGTARVKIPLSRSTSISALTCVVLLALMLMGAGTAALLAICGVTAQMFSPGRKLIAHQVIFNAGMISVAVFLSSRVNTLLWPSTGEFYMQALAMLAATLMYYAINSTSVAIIVGLATHKRAYNIWRAQFAHTSVSFMISGFVSYGIYLAIR